MKNSSGRSYFSRSHEDRRRSHGAEYFCARQDYIERTVADCALSDMSLDYEVSFITHFHLKSNRYRLNFRLTRLRIEFFPYIQLCYSFWEHVCVCTTSVSTVTREKNSSTVLANSSNHSRARRYNIECK